MSEWISVDDRLPEFTGTYLVVGEVVEMEFSVFCIDYGWQYDEYLITHWMPLPEQPDQYREI